MPDRDAAGVLVAFANAWGSRDIEAIMSLMTDDCVYEASVGPGPGTVYEGSEAVRAGILSMLEHDAGSVAEVSNLFTAGDRGAWEWTYTWKAAEGESRSVRGCDLFEFADGRIRRKNAFRKTVA